MRRTVVEPGQAARGEINDVRHAVSRSEAAVRGLILTGEERFRLRLLEAESEERAAFARLLPLSRALDPDLAAAVRELQAQSRRASADRVALVRDIRTGEIPERLLQAEEERHDRLLHGAERIRSEIVALVAGARGDIRRVERVDTLLTVVLALLALVSGVVVLWIGRGYRVDGGWDGIGFARGGP